MWRNRVLTIIIDSITYAIGRHRYKLWLQMINNVKYNVFNGISEHTQHIIISLVKTFILMLNNGSE